METLVLEIAERIKGLRKMLKIAPEDMAASTGVRMEEYLNHENGERDFSFTFLYRCADKLAVDIVELLTEENPRLSFCSIVRGGAGLESSAGPALNIRILMTNLKIRSQKPSWSLLLISLRSRINPFLSPATRARNLILFFWSGEGQDGGL